MTKSQIWDITPLVTSQFPFWPNSEPLQRLVSQDINNGDAFTCSAISGTVHLGAHADAPSHYAREGITIDACPLHHYLGLCQVIRPKVQHGEPITKQLVTQTILAPRVLFATSTFDFSKPFREDYAAFDPNLFEWLAQHSVMTIGIDGPSVDLYHAKDSPCHHLAYKYGVAIIENLDLEKVPEGVYELIALPLKIKGFDASPVRAILRSIN